MQRAMVGGHEKLGNGPPFLPGSLLYCTDTTVLSGTVGTVHPEHLRRATHMAKQTTVTLVDDLDGKKAAEQVEFAVDGMTYEIDLSAANSARLRQALAPF